MRNTWLVMWLTYVVASYLIPWRNRVYFLWDDVEFLMRMRAPNLKEFFIPHQYQSHPLFNAMYWLELHLFGIDPGSFFTVAVLTHLLNIALAARIMWELTHSRFFVLLTAILVSFNKSYYTVIFWHSIFSNQMVTTFLLLAVILFLRLQRRFSVRKATLMIAVLVLASASQGFGVGAGFIFALTTWGFWNQFLKRRVVTIGIIAGMLSLFIMFPFTIPEVSIDRAFSLTPRNFINLAYFTAVGPTQAIITRFFLPGFVPNIHDPVNIVVMFALPGTVITWFLFIVLRTAKRRIDHLAPLFLFGSYTVIPYFIAGLARSRTGALGGIAERYIYLPFFFFILLFTWSLYLGQKTRLIPNTKLAKTIMIGAALILSAGQQAVMHLEVNQLFL